MIYKSVLVPVSAITPAGGGFDRPWAEPADAIANVRAAPKTTFANAVENPEAAFIQYSPQPGDRMEKTPCFHARNSGASC
jgi:hypothetical protein